MDCGCRMRGGVGYWGAERADEGEIGMGIECKWRPATSEGVCWVGERVEVRERVVEAVHGDVCCYRYWI